MGSTGWAFCGSGSSHLPGRTSWNICSDLIGPTQTGAFLNLIPVFTALLVLLFGGAVTLTQLAGGALVLLGVTFANRKARVAR